MHHQLSLLEASRLDFPELTDRERVRMLADRVLADLDARAPVDLGMVASYQGIHGVRRCALPNGGCLVRDPSTGRIEIRLRAGDHPRRQRFTGFHEVSHTFMPGWILKTQWRCDPPLIEPTKAELESLCDAGAAELLLPRRLVEPQLVEAPFGMETLCDLADLYDASLQAAGHRLVDLWPEDAMLVVAEEQLKPTQRADPDAEPLLRVSYAWRRGDWPFILKWKSIEPGDVLDRAHQGEIVDERTTLRGIATREAEGLHVSAKACPYTDGRGRSRSRVLALYRRPRRRD